MGQPKLQALGQASSGVTPETCPTFSLCHYGVLGFYSDCLGHVIVQVSTLEPVYFGGKENTM